MILAFFYLMFTIFYDFLYIFVGSILTTLWSYYQPESFNIFRSIILYSSIYFFDRLCAGYIMIKLKFLDLKFKIQEYMNNNQDNKMIQLVAQIPEFRSLKRD